MKLWKGRFTKEVDQQVNDFNSSISFDSRMLEQDIAGSIAHATMLGECNIISKCEAEQIVQGLADILDDINSGKLEIDLTDEDIHTFVEATLTARIGDAGKRLHTARSRNDQVAVDIKLHLKEQIDEITVLIKKLEVALCTIAKANTDTIMPGYTHMQRAQPITLAHHVMAYAQMFLRDATRLADAKKRMDVMPLGSGALAATTYPIDRQLTAKLLGFSGITMNSLDGVSDRDFCIELASALSIIMMHLSRFCEEIILWCSWEFQFIELDDAYSTGSSIMPQKKNPDIAELIRGKTGRVYGDLITLLTMMKGLPLAYNKDMQEDKEAIFDSVDTVKLCVSTFIPMIETMQVKRDKMREAAAKGFINATDCADYLVYKGMAFRDAYQITGQLVAYCSQNQKTLETLTIDEYKTKSDRFESDIYNAITPLNCVNGRKVLGGPAIESVLLQIKTLEDEINEI